MKKLKPCAISSIFKGQPSYLSTPLSAKRPTTSSSQSRLEKENLRIQRCEEELFKKETISDCHELSEKLKSAKLPSDFIIVKGDNFILFLNIDVSCDTPSVLSSVKVKSDMTFEVTVRNASISPRKFRHLLQDHKKITKISEVLNLLAEVKSLASDGCSIPDLLIEVVIDMISHLLSLPENEMILNVKMIMYCSLLLWLRYSSVLPRIS